MERVFKHYYFIIRGSEKISIQDIFLLGVTAGAVITDLREEKIKNKWILGGILFGIGIRILEEGVYGLLFAFLGMSVPLVLLWIAFCERWIGAGDIKLFSVLGSILGMGRILECMMAALLFGAFYAAICRLAGRKKKTIRLSIPILCSVFCGIGGLY
ncbi:MAG: A24 family peptidase [Eubacteriales bacterium]|nr:A24 family peptidase [Eubacteriales bacterium]